MVTSPETDRSARVNRVDRNLRSSIAQLELVSHAPTQNFDPIPRDSASEPGGKKPGQSNIEYRPKDTEEEMAWFASYHRKTPEYFKDLRSQVWKLLQETESYHPDDDLRTQALEVAGTALDALRDDVDKCVAAWRKRPVTTGQPPTMADPEWKHYIATCGRETAELVREYSCSRQYINAIKRMDWGARNESPEENKQRERREWKRRHDTATDEPKAA
jgi:hypothetical protein